MRYIAIYSDIVGVRVCFELRPMYFVLRFIIILLYIYILFYWFVGPIQAVKSLIEDINEEIDVQAQEEEFEVPACASALLLSHVYAAAQLCVCIRSAAQPCVCCGSAICMRLLCCSFIYCLFIVYVQAEVELMKRIRHPNVVSLLGHCLADKP